MPIFKLKMTGDDISDAELIEASKTNLDLEKHLECWLERSPWAIAQEPLLLIGRQSSASFEGDRLLPDLLGIDKDGNLVVAELKKGRTPRETVAQLLEYAAWADELSNNSILELVSDYFSTNTELQSKEFDEIFCETFEAEELPPLGERLRLFIAAEEISPTVSRVCRYLRTTHGIDVNCVEFCVYQTESGEILVSSQVIVGQEEVTDSKKRVTQRWSGDKPVKQVVWEAVQEVTGRDEDHVFSPKDVSDNIHKKYPTFNKSTVGCQIISDCVNHTSRHHYPGGSDRYWWIEKGKYRLYVPDKDRL